MNNNISQLSYSGVPNLQSLEVRENNLSSIYLSGLPGLRSLGCSSNQLTSLDVSMLTQLTGLWCANNQIASLDVSKLANLETLVCNNNKLTSLSIAGLSNLKQLNCQNNYIKNTRALEQWANTATSFSTILPQNVQAGDATNTGNAENDGTLSDAGKWIKDRRGWWYRYSDGGYAMGLAQINGKTYFFDAQGWMQSGWQQPRGKATWYYFGTANDGAMKTTVWLKDGKKWYYIGADGVMVTGLKPVDDRLYYFSDSGSMVSGWKQIGANWYYFGGPNDGAMKTGWIKSGGKWYYLDAEGVMLTGLQPVNGKVYYFSSSGAMLSGWQQPRGKATWYYFGGANDGAMKTSKWVGNYWLEADGVMATNAWVDSGKYFVDANGRWVKGMPKA